MSPRPSVTLTEAGCITQTNRCLHKSHLFALTHTTYWKKVPDWSRGAHQCPRAYWCWSSALSDPKALLTLPFVRFVLEVQVGYRHVLEVQIRSINLPIASRCWSSALLDPKVFLHTIHFHHVCSHLIALPLDGHDSMRETASGPRTAS